MRKGAIGNRIANTHMPRPTGGKGSSQKAQRKKKGGGSCLKGLLQTVHHRRTIFNQLKERQRREGESKKPDHEVRQRGRKNYLGEFGAISEGGFGVSVNMSEGGDRQADNDWGGGRGEFRVIRSRGKGRWKGLRCLRNGNVAGMTWGGFAFIRTVESMGHTDGGRLPAGIAGDAEFINQRLRTCVWAGGTQKEGEDARTCGRSQKKRRKMTHAPQKYEAYFS